MRLQNYLLCVTVVADFLFITEAVVPDKGSNNLRKFEKKETVPFQDEVEREVMGLWKRMLQFSVPTMAPSPSPTTAPSPSPTTAAPVVPQGEECSLQVSGSNGVGDPNLILATNLN